MRPPKKTPPPLVASGERRGNSQSAYDPKIAIPKPIDKLVAVVADGIAWRLSLYTLAMPAREAR